MLSTEKGAEQFVDDLREMLRQRQVVAVVGSGVSTASNRNAPTWWRLIDSGVERCRSLGVSEDQCNAIHQLLQLRAGNMLILAAEAVEQKLKESGSGEMARWLRDQFEDLQPDDPTVIRLLAACFCSSTEKTFKTRPSS